MEKQKSSVRYAPEVRARAVRMVLEHAGEISGLAGENVIGKSGRGRQIPQREACHRPGHKQRRKHDREHKKQQIVSRVPCGECDDRQDAEEDQATFGYAYGKVETRDFCACSSSIMTACALRPSLAGTSADSARYIERVR